MSTITTTSTRSSIMETQPSVAKTVRIHRFSPNVTYIPPRPAAKRGAPKLVTTLPTPTPSRSHRRMRSNTTPPLPTPGLVAATVVGSPRKSEDVPRPQQQQQHGSSCKWRFHSVASPCLCENEAPRVVAPVDVMSLRQLPGANTPWLGSPSWTNFGNAPWGSPQSESQPTFPTRSESMATPPTPQYQTVTRSKSAPEPQPWSPNRDGRASYVAARASYAPYRSPVACYPRPSNSPRASAAFSPRASTCASTRALLSVNTTAASSQRSSWASFDSTCPPLSRPDIQRPSTSPSANTISPISPLSFEQADWPNFHDYHVEVVSHHGDIEDIVSPTSTMNNMAWSGLCLTGTASMTPKATIYEPRPFAPSSQTSTPTQPRPLQPRPQYPSRHGSVQPSFDGPFLSIVDLPPRAASADMFRSQIDRDASVAALPQRATTVSHSPKDARPARFDSIKRKPVADLKLTLPDKATARHITMSPAEGTPGWRHTIAYPSEDRIPDAYPSRAVRMSGHVMDDSGLPTPRLGQAHAAVHHVIPRVIVEEVSHPRLGFGRRPSKQALRLAAEEQLRRRTIEPSGIGLDSEQWLDLQLAVMGIPASWNSGADAPMSASIF